MTNTGISGRRSEGRCLMLLSPLLSFRSARLWSVFHRCEVKEFAYYEISQHCIFFFSKSATTYIRYLLVSFSSICITQTHRYTHKNTFHNMFSVIINKDEHLIFPTNPWEMADGNNLLSLEGWPVLDPEESVLYHSMNKYFNNP